MFPYPRGVGVGGWMKELNATRFECSIIWSNYGLNLSSCKFSTCNQFVMACTAITGYYHQPVLHGKLTQPHFYDVAFMSTMFQKLKSIGDRMEGINAQVKFLIHDFLCCLKIDKRNISRQGRKDATPVNARKWCRHLGKCTPSGVQGGRDNETKSKKLENKRIILLRAREFLTFY